MGLPSCQLHLLYSNLAEVLSEVLLCCIESWIESREHMHVWQIETMSCKGHLILQTGVISIFHLHRHAVQASTAADYYNDYKHVM